MHLTARQDGGGFKLYHYDPTIAAAVVFVVAFGLTTLYHSWQMLRTRCWIATPLVIGGFLQVVGYLARAVSGNESPDWTLTPYIIQAIFLLIAPALYAATIYMEFGRIITFVDGKQHTLIRHNWITKICICGDVLSFVLQGGGGGYQSSGTLEALHAGANIIIIGLFVQLAFFGFFMVIALTWYVKMLRFSSSQAYCCPWKKLMCVLFGTSMLIMIRSVFRAAEYLEGDDGYLLAHEVYLYIFDALLMLAVMAILNVVHPSAATKVSTKHNETKDTLDLHLDRYYQDA